MMPFPWHDHVTRFAQIANRIFVWDWLIANAFSGRYGFGIVFATCAWSSVIRYVSMGLYRYSAAISLGKSIINDSLVFIMRKQFSLVIPPGSFLGCNGIKFPFKFAPVSALQEPEIIEDPASMLLACMFAYNSSLGACHAHS